MTTLIAELHGAFKEVGASDEKARMASDSAAAYEARLAGFNLRLERLDSKLTLLTWLVGADTALVLLVLGKLFVP